MSNAFIYVFHLLAIETLFDSIMLVEVVALDQASQLRLLELLLHLAEREFNCIVLGRVRHDPYPLDLELSHQINRVLSLVSCQIVHHNGDPFAIVDLTELPEETTE